MMNRTTATLCVLVLVASIVILIEDLVPPRAMPSNDIEAPLAPTAYRTDTSARRSDAEESGDDLSLAVAMKARGLPGTDSTSSPVLTIATEAALAHASAATLALRIDGALCDDVRLGLRPDAGRQVLEVDAAALSRAANGTFALVTADRARPRWSGPIDVATLAAGVHTFDALPTVKVRGQVVELGSGEVVTGATLTAQFRGESPWADWLCEAQPIEALADDLGRFELESPCAGTFELSCSSPRHVTAKVTVEVQGEQFSVPPIELEPRPTVRVHLVGVKGLPEQHYAAHTVTGTRAYFADDWTADVLLDRDVPFLELAVGLPGDIEITTFLEGTPADAPESVTIDLSAAAVDVTLLGQSPVEERLLVVVFYTDASGREVFSNVWAQPGETKQIPIGAAGEVSVDAGFLAADRTPRTLVRRTVAVAPGQVHAVTIDLPQTAPRVALLDSEGRRFGAGEVWYSFPGAAFLATPGGTLDPDGTALLPDLEHSPLWLSGSVTDAEILYAGVELHVGAAKAPITEVALGSVQSTALELVAPTGEAIAPAVKLRLVCARSGQPVTLFEVPPGGRETVNWMSASNALVEFLPLDVWSPREPLRLTPGEMRVPFVPRAWLVLECGARELADALHIESGLTLAELRADPTVRIERFDGGVRLWGVPSGRYRVTLAGDSAPRGPISAAPLKWSVIERHQLEGS